MVGGQDDQRGSSRSPHLLHPPVSPVRIDGQGDRMGLGSGGRGSQRRMSRARLMRAQERHGSSWWYTVEQRLVRRGVDFAPDSQEGAGDEFVFLPDSDDYSNGGGSSDPNSDEVVPETEVQDLVPMETNTKAPSIPSIVAMEENVGNDGVGLLSGAAGLMQQYYSDDSQNRDLVTDEDLSTYVETVDDEELREDLLKQYSEMFPGMNWYVD